MNWYKRIPVALSLVSVAALACANPELKAVTPTFYPSANGNLNAGLVVEAATDLPVLVIGGGFTISCSSSTLQHTAERRATFSGFFSRSVSLQIPEVVPSTYAIPGWSSIPLRSCGQCVMHYKGEVRDETSLQIRIGNAGAGASFTLIPAGEASAGNSTLTEVCRLGNRQCCTSSCQLP